MSSKTVARMRDRILRLVAEFETERQAASGEFEQGKTPVRYAGRVFGPEELVKATDAVLDFWLTAGRYSEEFESRLSEWLGTENALLVNSGSSANLVAMTALTSPRLGERRLKPGDEVITVAAGFPTTVAPIIQNRLVPVFVDVELGTYNAQVEAIRRAVGPRTRAIALAHTLGNPWDVEGVLAIARENDLWVVEDNCDALGSLYKGQKTGTFGHLATISFYPAHHMTLGEGGAVVTD
jgi:CDP-6-deoxy-D-xylo-4-hexulose-3-dehydrase